MSAEAPTFAVDIVSRFVNGYQDLAGQVDSKPKICGESGCSEKFRTVLEERGLQGALGELRERCPLSNRKLATTLVYSASATIVPKLGPKAKRSWMNHESPCAVCVDCADQS